MMDVEVPVKDNGRLSILALNVFEGGFKVDGNLTSWRAIQGTNNAYLLGSVTLTHRASSPTESGIFRHEYGIWLCR